jgi:segregation and condensation protein A
MSLVVQLPKFEGPLALLLYLIRKEEMDIFDIKIHEITNQYLEYIKIMKELDLELAGEFVAMAATLIQIKSRMLLPQYDEKGEVIEVEDPRKELVQKLLEYQKYQEAAKLLYDRPLVGRDMWTRGFRESLDEPPEEIEVEDNGLFSLISVYRLIMRSAKKRVHQVTAKAQSIASRILEIKDMLIMGQRKTLNDLIGIVDDKTRQVLITFLSLLELGKLGFVSLYQTENYTDIWVELRKPIEGDAVSRVEEYDTVHSSEVADKLFDEKHEDVDHTKDNAEEFVLKDAEDVPEVEIDEPLFAQEEMASDEEIFLAEKELSGELLPLEQVAAVEPLNLEESIEPEGNLELVEPAESVEQAEEMSNMAETSLEALEGNDFVDREELVLEEPSFEVAVLEEEIVALPTEVVTEEEPTDVNNEGQEDIHG